MGGKKKNKAEHVSKQKQKQGQRNMKHFHRKRGPRVVHGGAEWHSDFKKLSAQLEPYGLMIKDVAGDGNCLFRAMADQLETAPANHEKYREAIVKYVEEHREMFEPFVEDDVPFPDYVDTPKGVKPTTKHTYDRPTDDFEISVMDASGCQDIVQVRQALEDNEYDFDATLAYLLMMQQTADGATDHGHHHHHLGVHEIAHTVHHKISKILHHEHHEHHEHHGYQEHHDQHDHHNKQKGDKHNNNANHSPDEITRDLGALCI